MEILKRVTAALLALVMVVTMVPLSALAEEVVGDGVLDVPETAETESAETVETVVPDGPEAAETEVVETAPETTAPEVFAEETAEAVDAEETWEIGDIEVEETAETLAAGEVIASGNCGENVNWTLDSNGTLVISGEGPMDDYDDRSSKRPPWINNELIYKISTIIVEEGVTTIGDYAFYAGPYTSKWKSVLLPDSLASIGSNAFYNWDCLSSIAIPDGVTSIGSSAFSYCDNLTKITIPDSVNFIGSSAFAYCTSLISAVIPEGVTSLDRTFQGCKNLSSVTLSNSIVSIDDYVFYSCEKLYSIVIPNRVTSIGNSAFSGCLNLLSIEIPDGVSEIGKEAFSYCTGLTHIEIPYGVETLDETFVGCKNLISATLPDSIIYLDAFAGCSSLASIDIPERVSYIGPNAFSNCKSLTSIVIPERVRKIDEKAFYHCDSLKSVTIPDSVTSIGQRAFLGCDSLTNVTIPGRVTSVGDYAFNSCANLCSITMGDSVTYIGDSAFQYCYNLTDVYYAGSEEQWKAINIRRNNFGAHFMGGQSPVTIHYNIPMTVKDFYQMKVAPNSNTFSIPSGTELELTCSLYCNDKPVTDWGNPIVTSSTTGVVKDKGWEKIGDNWVLTIEGAEPGQEKLEITEFRSGDVFATIIDVQPTPIKEYVDNNEIHINGAGSAFAYYQGDPNTTYQYTVNGEADSVISDDKGIIRIILGTYPSGTTNEHIVTFTQVGNKVLSPSISFHSTVVAEELAYTYEAQSSFDVSVGVEAGKIGISVGTGVGLGIGTTIRRDYDNGNCTMETYDQAKLDAYGKFQLGMPDEFGIANINFANASAQISATGMGIYGHRYQNYQGSTENVKAFATFLLGETLQEKSDFVFLQEFQQWLANKLYTQTTMDSIRGSGASISGELGADYGNFEINDVQLVSGLKGNVEISAAISEKSYSSGGNEYSTSYTSNAELDLASMNVFGGALGADFLSRDNSVTVRKENGEKTLESTTIGSGDIGVSSILTGGRCTTNYKHYIFEEDSLKELMEKSETITSYVNGDRIALSNKDIEKIATTISDCDVPVAYTESEKTHRLGTLDLEFGLPLGIDMEFGAELTSMESVEYQTAGGYAVKDEILITSESGDYSAVVEKELISLKEAIDNAVASLKEDADNFFTKVGDTIQKGAETVWGWIDGAADSISDWFVSLTCASSEDVWGISYEIDIKSDQVNFALARQVSTPSEAYATRSAITIGRPFIVNVTDGTTGEQVKDFGAEPLTFTIRYAGEDLMAANYDAQTQVISMYRYSDNGDYFEYIGGIHDAEEKTVTATITKPGQYILAAEVMEEEEPGEDNHEYQLGDVNHDTKINAKDATLILQKSVGVLKDTAKFCEECAEVSGDGRLNAKDSTLILQFSVGLRQDFPARK